MGQALSQWHSSAAVQLAPDATSDLHKGPFTKPFGHGIRPFSEDWLNSCYTVGLMPNTQWQILVDEVNSRLAVRVKSQMNNAERRQTLFELLGEEFVSKHFPDEENQPHILEPPRVGWEHRQRLRGEGQSWLRLQVLQILREMGISKYVDLALGYAPHEVQSADREVHERFCAEMRAHLHGFMDDEILKSEQKFLLLLKDNPKFEPEVSRALITNHQDQLIAYSSAWNKSGADVIAMGEDYQRAHAEHLSILDFTDANSVAHNFYAVLHATGPKYPSFVSLQSRAVADSLSGLLQKEPGLLPLVRERMFGRPLCGSLRQTVWKAVLLDSERRRMNAANPQQSDFVLAVDRTQNGEPPGTGSHSLIEVQHAVRDRFGKALARGMSELRLRTATVSPVDGMLQNLVRELYKRVQPLSAFKTESRLRETIRTTNVVYVHSRKFDSYWIMRLHALQLAFAPSNTNVLSSIRAKLDQLGLQRARNIAAGLDDPNAALLPNAQAHDSARRNARVLGKGGPPTPKPKQKDDPPDCNDDPAKYSSRKRKQLSMSAKLGLDKLGVRKSEWAAANVAVEGHDDAIEGWNPGDRRDKCCDHHHHGHHPDGQVCHHHYHEHPDDAHCHLEHLHHYHDDDTDTKQQASVADHIYELAMMLTILNNEMLFPSWPEIYKIVDRTFELLHQVDVDYVAWLDEVSMVNIQFKPNEFTAREISLDPAKSHILFDVGLTSEQRADYERELLGAPTFVRKWLGDLFVSTLRTPAMLFIWDQCFMENWNPQCLVDMCLALLLLVRAFAFRAENWVEMKEVLMTFPQYLYTADIMKAWIHLHRSGNPLEVPLMNRRRPPERRKFLPPPQIEPLIEKLLPPVGIRDIVVKLVLHSDQLFDPNSLESQFADTFDVRNLFLFCHLMFGDTELSVQEAEVKPALIGINRQNGHCVIALKYPPFMAFVFHNISLSNYYDIELELRSFPYLLICANYWLPNGQLATLGWARVQIYSDKKNTLPDNVGRGTARTNAAVETLPPSDPVVQLLLSGDWQLAISKRSYPLHPGNVPEIITLGDTDAPADPGAPPQPSRNIHYDRTASEADLPSARMQAVSFDKLRDPLAPNKLMQDEDIDVIGGVKLSPESELAAYVFDPFGDPIPRPGSPATPPPLPGPDKQAWLPQRPSPEIPLAAPHKPNDPLDVYFDELRFVPDCVYLVRLTCHFLHASEQTDLNKSYVAPDVTSEPRHPRFRASDRLMVNTKYRYELSPRTLLLVRVYALCLPHFQVCVLGNCLISLFDADGRLRSGAYQIRLRGGLPRQPIDTIDDTSLFTFKPIPAATLLFRLTPHTDLPTAAPMYEERVYQNTRTEPNSAPTPFERELMHHYLHDPDYPSTYENAINTLKQFDTDFITVTISQKRRMVEYINRRLDKRNQQIPARQLMLGNMLRYDQHIGVRIGVIRAFDLYANPPNDTRPPVVIGPARPKRVFPNMNSNLFTVAITRVYPGVQIVSRAEDVNDVTVYTTHLNADSLYNDPVWHDDYSQIQPTFDARTLLIVQFFGVEIQNSATNPFALSEYSVIGWTALPLYRLKFANFGYHHLPVFRCEITDKLLKDLQDAACNSDPRQFDNFLRTSRMLRSWQSNASCVIHIIQDFIDREMQKGKQDYIEQMDLIVRCSEAYQGIDLAKQNAFRRARGLFLANKLKDETSRDQKRNDANIMRILNMTGVGAAESYRATRVAARDNEKAAGVVVGEFLRKQIPVLWPYRYAPILAQREGQ